MTTPDSPKGPACNCAPCRHEAAERTAPIPCLRRHVAEAIYDALKIYQHEADTLVPQAEDDERVPTLEALRSQRRRYARDEGRPSGSERLAPRSVAAFSYEAMLKTLFRRDDGLYVCVCGEQVQECLSHWGGTDWTCKPKWHRSAAQAARSEATPKQWRDIRGCEWEEVAPDDDLRLVRTDPSHCTEEDGPTLTWSYVETHYGPLIELPSSSPRVFREFHLGEAVEPRDVDRLRDVEGDVWERRDTGQWHCLNNSACPALYFQRLLHSFGPLTEVPSPSLRKEGEDN